MSVNGFRPDVASRPGMDSSEIGSRVSGSISIIVKPSSPPQSASIRPRESKVTVAHSRSP
jgi:hypothetical protein